MASAAKETPILIGQTGPLRDQRWALQGTVVLGREASCQIVIPDRQVSRRHASITVSEEQVVLTDLESKNGTYLNGKYIQQPVPLQDGDIIQIALAQEFVFISADATLPLHMSKVVGDTPPQMGLHLQKRSRRLWIGGKEVLPPLSAAQFRLLELLYEQEGRVVSREDLAAGIWGEEGALAVSTQALDALVRRLRNRLAAVDPDHEYIITVRGHGLRLDNLPSA
jgi:pSer/pThr/pTyr-binding forkhead associated (FHA) protein